MKVVPALKESTVSWRNKIYTHKTTSDSQQLPGKEGGTNEDALQAFQTVKRLRDRRGETVQTKKTG